MALPSRIHFAVADLVEEVRRLLPGVEVPEVAIGLDADGFEAVLRELENQTGRQLPAVRAGTSPAVKFAGARIVRMPEVKSEPPMRVPDVPTLPNEPDAPAEA